MSSNGRLKLKAKAQFKNLQMKKTSNRRNIKRQPGAENVKLKLWGLDKSFNGRQPQTVKFIGNL